MNLDVRDFNFWTREADREMTKKRLDEITATRLGQADRDSFLREYEPLYYKLKFMEDEDNE